MATFQDLMPNLNPLLRTLSQFTRFTLPTPQLRAIGQRAASEAQTGARLSQAELENIRRALSQQRQASAQYWQTQQELLPRLFQQNLGGVTQQIMAQERQRGVRSSGLAVQNLLLGQTGALQSQADRIGQVTQQQANAIQRYLDQLLSQVLQPQFQLAVAQGQNAMERYQRYLNAAYEALQNRRLQEAELLLTQAQLEYNAAILGEQDRLLAEQARYQQQLTREQAGYQEALRSEETGSFYRTSSGQVTGVPYSNLINRYAQQFGVSPDLVARVIRAESNFNPRARSHAGAMGLMQLMPGTARGLGVTNPWDPEQNIRGGTQYLAQQLRRWNGNVALALASYNAGPGNVQKWVRQAGTTDWRVVKRYAFKETRNYVDKILGGR